MPRDVETLINWHDPNEDVPPFDEVILVALGSWRDEDDFIERRHVHTEIRTIKVSITDADGDGEEGALMKTDLIIGAQKWDDLQFTLVDDDGDEISDSFSDSIMWWAEMPNLPQRRD